ncbi:mechanosensitive ion channel family protein [Georgenia sp. SYP-B2076]|uniref:mechanosensitive ion channel family protein n=1 Tax=Georgenia sp. SYP-B2076 TaxID=2495881 RepID=UPI00272AF438|nr:mechanosensitive ion channel domain-containing protein [Georgenia sp. SYP-B2076]
MTPASLDKTVETTVSFLTVVLWVAGGIFVGLLVSYAITGAMRVVNRRHPIITLISRRERKPLRVILVIVGAWTGLVLATPVAAGIREPTWRALAQHGLLMALIAAITWLAAGLLRVMEDTALARIRAAGDPTSHARRIQTQAQVLRRVGVAVIVVLGIAAILLTFPGMRAAGASILASAGILSVVAGLAAQTTLGNVFAGLQLALTDAIRVDDVVIVQGQFGHVEEITLTYVVVRLWDDRRMIMPSTDFTTKPFENWTRQAPELLGTVEFDVDWRVPVPAVRLELERLLRLTDMWDGRVGILQVEKAVGGVVQVRALVSGKDAPTLTDLKYYLRENLVDWFQTQAPYALPRTRLEQQDVVEVTEDRNDILYDELAQELTELADLDGAQVPTQDTLVEAPVQQDPEERRKREAAARRARRRASREDRRSLRTGGGLGRAGDEQRRRPSSDATQVMDPIELGLDPAEAPGGAHRDDARTASSPERAAAAPAPARTPAAEPVGAPAPQPEGAPAPAPSSAPAPERTGASEPVPAADHDGQPRPDMRRRRSLRERLQPGPAPEPPGASTAVLAPITTTAGHEASLFTGSPEAEERAQAFSGPGPEAQEERELVAERKRAAADGSQGGDDAQRAREVFGKDASPDGDGGDGD